MRGLKLFLPFIMLAVITACAEKDPGMHIMTVNGIIPATELGQTLPHEHVMVDWIGADSTGYHRWERDSVVSVVLPYLIEVNKMGVNGFADCSPAYLGRDPLLLKELSEKSGIHIITNTGYYGAVNNRFIPSYAWDETAEQLAGRWIEEFVNGIDGSGIKPGFIKIGVKEDTLLSGLHRKLVKAAALTHKETGLVIKSHTGGNAPAFDQIELLLQEGVSPDAFIWTHAQAGNIASLIEAARMGVWISLDGVNISGTAEKTGNKDMYVDLILNLKGEGLLSRVLLSHDAGWYDAGEPAGGGFRAYTDIHRHLIPALEDNGLTPEDIEMLLSVNPSMAFAIRSVTKD